MTEALAGRTFSFYPAIRNIEHNEWRLGRAEWSEVQVINTATGAGLWVPRRYFGEISSVEEPVVIVGLERELEYKAGRVWPYERRVIDMPAAPAPRAPRLIAHVPAARRAEAAESRATRLVGTVVLGGVVVCLLIVGVVLAGRMRPVKLTATDQDFLVLSRDDDYFAVVRKLGPPAESRWKSEKGELQFQALSYPQRGYYVILLGADRGLARYIGALDRNWRVVHSVNTPGGTDYAAMLRGLERF